MTGASEHRRKLTQRRRDAEAQSHRNITTSQPRRLEDTNRDTESSQGKTAKAPRHRTLDDRPIGRTATARSRGIEARKGDRQTPAFVESTFLRLGSRLRRARPASVAEETSAPFHAVTLSEGVRRPSRRVPIGSEARSSRVIAFSNCGNPHRFLAGGTPAPQWRSARCVADILPALRNRSGVVMPKAQRSPTQKKRMCSLGIAKAVPLCSEHSGPW